MYKKETNPGLEVTIEKKQEGIYLVRPNGRIDSETYTLLEEKIKPLLVPSTKAAILDMAKVFYISSAGLATIFNAKKIIESNKGALVLTNLQPQIKKVFEVIKALPPQNIFKNIEEADNYLSAIQRKEIEKQKQKG